MSEGSIPTEILEVPSRILREVSRVVYGQDDVKLALVMALFCEGHVLIEGLPGTAKTTLAKVFAMAIGGEFKRIQFTPDMLPSDITGFYMYTISGESIFRPGPIFANVVLADELNRATPRTQAALLEAMQERQVTIEGKTHQLPRPFIVIASQLPYGAEGTYPLTEVQIDRFLFRVWCGYPKRDVEKNIIRNIDSIEEIVETKSVKTVTSPKELLKVIGYVKKVYVDDKIVNYIIDIVNNLREHPDVAIGPSPRASIALFKGARVKAMLSGRDYVIPDDVKSIAHLALDHRIRLSAEAEIEGRKPEEVVEEVLRKTPVPKW